MYTLSGIPDDESCDLVQSSQSSSHSRRATPWMLTIGLLAVAGCSGLALRRTSQSLVREGEIVGKDVNLLESQIRVKMDVLGVDYDKLGDKQEAFRNAVEGAIVAKGKIAAGSAVVDETTMETSSPSDKDDSEPPRSEFLVKITVPMELSAAALIQRLHDDGDILQDIKAEIQEHIPETTNVVVQSQKFKEFTSKTSLHALSSTDSHNPLIILDIDVKGACYTELGKSKDSQTSFVAAVRDGIVATQSGVEAKNIGLDISNGGRTGDTCYVHVVAKIPVPEGLSADAFMSQWKGGHADIGDSISKTLKDIPTLQQFSTNNAGVPYPIEVSTGPLHLGALRTSYASKISLEVDAFDIDHNGDVDDNVKADDILNKVQELLAKQAGLDKEHVKIDVVTKPAGSDDEARKTNNPLRMQTKMYVHTESESGLTADDWMKKLGPVAYEAQQYFRTTAPAATKKDDYRIHVGVNEVSNSPEFIELDLVVHGIDYADLSAQRQRAFLSEFADAVRSGVAATPDPTIGHLTAVKGQIEVVVSDPGVKGAVNVRAKIPAPADVGDLQKVMIDLDEQLRKDTIQKDVESELRDIETLSLVTTWTPEAIRVTEPGEMDDFAGDLAITADQQ